jgi:hypothetical protein
MDDVQLPIPIVFVVVSLPVCSLTHKHAFAIFGLLFLFPIYLFIYIHISVLSNSHACGRAKGFHTIIVHAVCDRRGEVKRKRRSDARTGGGGGTGKVVPRNVDTAISIHTNTDIPTFPNGILTDDTRTSHGDVDIDDPIMLPLPDELTTTTTLGPIKMITSPRMTIRIILMMLYTP